METEIIVRVINKLVGDIEPVGDSTIDAQRYVNLDHMCKIVDELIYQIKEVRRYKHRDEYSMKRSGDYADKFLKDLTNEII